MPDSLSKARAKALINRGRELRNSMLSGLSSERTLATHHALTIGYAGRVASLAETIIAISPRHGFEAKILLRALIETADLLRQLAKEQEQARVDLLMTIEIDGLRRMQDVVKLAHALGVEKHSADKLSHLGTRIGKAENYRTRNGTGRPKPALAVGSRARNDRQSAIYRLDYVFLGHSVHGSVVDLADRRTVQHELALIGTPADTDTVLSLQLAATDYSVDGSEAVAQILGEPVPDALPAFRVDLERAINALKG